MAKKSVSKAQIKTAMKQPKVSGRATGGRRGR